MDSRSRRGNRQSPLGFGATEQSAIDVEPDWWRDFFTDFYNSFAPLMQSEEGTIREVGYILDCLEPPTGGHLLDVPCGTGRHSLELARRGFAVTGVELSEEAIDMARHDARERNLMITLAQRDMRDLPWDDAFDGAFCFFGSFGYFDEVENGKFLNSVFRTLKPGARFVIETHVAETLLPRFAPRGWRCKDELSEVQEKRLDANPLGTTRAGALVQIAIFRNVRTPWGLKRDSLSGTNHRASAAIHSWAQISPIFGWTVRERRSSRLQCKREDRNRVSTNLAPSPPSPPPIPQPPI